MENYGCALKTNETRMAYVRKLALEVLRLPKLMLLWLVSTRIISAK
jgi:hypothetical protein